MRSARFAGKAGSKISWSLQFGFSLKDEPVRKRYRELERKNSEAARHHSASHELWWRIAHTLTKLGRTFSEAEIAAASGSELASFGNDWLRQRLLRAANAKPPISKANIVRYLRVDWARS
ncbi:hypothetical protein [Bradyrhizobium zhanjiangense]|uniref:Uncharacterized protein n=1 Tax=Bradyrhizobium zhanjiangense TaxID=1325107 RepID=A0A4Q0Q895_9BRAD|nr:hypothetical protein [Bradyrhizobium zhanjiangense]RXG85687.1 hypothetical protein EAS61_35495 [Bradyrhizobium zhanjiangense]